MLLYWREPPYITACSLENRCQNPHLLPLFYYLQYVRHRFMSALLNKKTPCQSNEAQLLSAFVLLTKIMHFKIDDNYFSSPKALRAHLCGQ